MIQSESLRHYLLNLLTALSLLLCIAVVVLWAIPRIRDTGVGVGFDVWRPHATTMVQHRVGVVAIPGRLQFQSKRDVHYGWAPSGPSPAPFPDRVTPMGPERPLAARQHWDPARTPLQRLGFEWDIGRVFVATHRMINYRWATAPTWLFVAVFAILPASRLRSELARRRLNRIGRCDA